MKKRLSGWSFLAIAFILVLSMFTACKESSSNSGGTKYEIAIDTSITGGTVTSSVKKAAKGAKVTMTTTPEGDNVMLSLDVTKLGETGTKVEATPVEGQTNKYQFIMPAFDVFVTAQFMGTEIGEEYGVIFRNGVIAANPQIWNDAHYDDIVFDAVGEGLENGTAISITLSAESWNGFEFTTDEPAYDLGEFNALSLWVRANSPTKFTSISFATDIKINGGVTYKGEDGNGIPITTSWTNILVPVPVSMPEVLTAQPIAFVLDQATAFFNPVHIDNIQLVQCDVSLNGITLHALNDISGPPNTTEIETLLTGNLKAEYKVEGRSVTLAQGTTNLIKWYKPSYTIGGSATESAGVLNPTQANSTYTMAITFGGKTSNTITCNILAKILTLSDFSLAHTWGAPEHEWWAPKPSDDGLLPTSAWHAETGVLIDGRPAVSFTGNEWGDPNISKVDAEWDISGYNTLRVGICIPDTDANKAAYVAGIGGQNVNPIGRGFSANAAVQLELRRGSTGWVILTPNNTVANIKTAVGYGKWFDVSFDLASYPNLDLTAVTGWRITYLNYNVGSGTYVAASAIKAYE